MSPPRSPADTLPGPGKAGAATMTAATGSAAAALGFMEGLTGSMAAGVGAGAASAGAGAAAPGTSAIGAASASAMAGMAAVAGAGTTSAWADAMAAPRARVARAKEMKRMVLVDMKEMWRGEVEGMRGVKWREREEKRLLWQSTDWHRLALIYINMLNTSCHISWCEHAYAHSMHSALTR